MKISNLTSSGGSNFPGLEFIKEIKKVGKSNKILITAIRMESIEIFLLVKGSLISLLEILIK